MMKCTKSISNPLRIGSEIKEDEEPFGYLVCCELAQSHQELVRIQPNTSQGGLCQ